MAEWERFAPGTAPDCARDIHQGTYQPAVASFQVDGAPLCDQHARALMPLAVEETADGQQANPDSGQAWIDRYGDVWRLGDDGLLHTPETRPFPREHVEKKWGPLRRAPYTTGGQSVRTIHKYALTSGMTVEVQTYERARFLHVANQREEITLWAEVNTMERECVRTLHIVGTGGSVPANTEFVGTALMAGGDYVFHVYADKEARRG